MRISKTAERILKKCLNVVHMQHLKHEKAILNMQRMETKQDLKKKNMI